MNYDAVIAVVCGGPSAEAKVSRATGRCIYDTLRVLYKNAKIIELDESIGDKLTKATVDVVFPALHGSPGEDGTFQGFLEILGIPYVGSRVHASACAMDKITAKRIYQAQGLPVARDMVVDRREGAKHAAERAAGLIGREVVVKPARQGSALGVVFCNDPLSLETAINQAFAYDDRVLIEERIQGREITVGILEQDCVEALPVIEIRTPKDSWYDYQHRYTPGYSEHIIPAPLCQSQYLRTQELAIAAHEALGCRDLSRVDFVVPDHGEPVILEVNTLPGMTSTSLYPDAARSAGISFEVLLSYLVERALVRSAGEITNREKNAQW